MNTNGEYTAKASAESVARLAAELDHAKETGQTFMLSNAVFMFALEAVAMVKGMARSHEEASKEEAAAMYPNYAALLREAMSMVVRDAYTMGAVRATVGANEVMISAAPHAE